MAEVLNQLLPITEWNETFRRDELCHICVLLDFCHLSLKHPGTNSVRIRSLATFSRLLTAPRKIQEIQMVLAFNTVKLGTEKALLKT